MDEQESLAKLFEEHRGHLRAVAHRILGSSSEADDAVQETWLRLSRSDADGIENLPGWLTTAVARVCLNMLRSRSTRPEESLGTHLPDPVVSPDDGLDPEHEAVLADSVGLALLVVLETLSPAERLAFVLHDMFAVPFDEIAPIVGRSPTATRQLASRARRRVPGATRAPDGDLRRQREVVNAFFAAARSGEFDRLVGLLDPSVVVRSDGGPAGPGTIVLHGAQAVAARAFSFAQPAARVWPAIVNGAAGVVVTAGTRTISVMGFTVSAGKIVAIYSFADPDRLDKLDLTAFNDAGRAGRADVP
jgi:RNA polymerase sigma-70 factor (ECF subfamily)